MNSGYNLSALVCLQRKLNRERCSFSDFALYIDTSAVAINNLLGDCQTYARALFLCREEGIKDFAQEVFRYTVAIVANLYPRIRREVHLKAEVFFRVLWVGIESVLLKVRRRPAGYFDKSLFTSCL